MVFMVFVISGDITDDCDAAHRPGRVAHIARPGISQNPLSSPAAAGGLMCEEYKIDARNGEISSSTFPSIS